MGLRILSRDGLRWWRAGTIGPGEMADARGDRQPSGRDPSTGYAFQKSGRALGAPLNANIGLGVRLGRWVGRASKLVARRALQFNPCSARGSV